MADFTKAVNPLLQSEGGYVDDPDDKGGETICGISRVHHPDWRGWVQIDGIKEARNVDIKTMINQYFENGEGHSLIQDFYITEYWSKIKGNEIESQTLADKLFDVAVNMGWKRAGKYLQSAINVANYKNEEISVDGLIGPKTLSALKSVSIKRQPLIPKMINIMQGNHYINIIRKDRGQGKFLRGWMKRVYI